MGVSQCHGEHSGDQAAAGLSFRTERCVEVREPGGAGQPRPTHHDDTAPAPWPHACGDPTALRNTAVGSAPEGYVLEPVCVRLDESSTSLVQQAIGS